ncbi:MAG: Fe-S cluster domain-containing protein [Prolixibacteraceae bacterium]|nr:Fe-S cluster domain-containing protein [Prolixibacteraceae bacterium]
MSEPLLYTVIILSAIGIAAAIILYLVARKFHVYEDPRIDQVEEALPAANCGGCGYAGCRAFAEAIVKDNSLDDKYCPVGGNEVMEKVASIMGLEAEQKAPRTAVVRCNGTCEHRPQTHNYEGVQTCAIAALNYSGETDCQYGCLGFGDCCTVCDFDAIHMNPETGLPEVIDENCVACGACVEACPRDLIELRKVMPKYRKVYVACRNMDKGGPARKACKVACIGCGKCEEVCKFDAITISNNLAFIDSDKCKLCRKCAPVCPTNAIIEENFPPPKKKQAEEKESKPAEA